MTEKRLPDFLVIGAVKAGTTSVHHCLDAHPEVFVPAQKETHFFDFHWGEGVGWYARHFSNGHRVVGEVCPGYAQHPFVTGVPERVHEVIPDVRLVYLVRHPIDRLYSHYRQHVLAGKQHMALRDAIEHHPNYLYCSLYATQIERFLEVFPREQLLIITDQRLADDRRGTLKRLYGFVGATSGWWDDRLDALQANVTDDKRVLRGPGPRLRKTPLRHAVSILPTPIVTAARRVASRPTVAVAVAPIDAELRADLERRLRPEVERLRRYVDGEFDGWGIG